MPLALPVQPLELNTGRASGTQSHRIVSATQPSVELEWSLVGLWAMMLYATAELVRSDISVQRLSVAKTLRFFRMMATDYLHPADTRNTLRIQLRNSLVDEYSRRTRKSRECPRKKKKDKPPGKPVIKAATKQQRINAAKLKRKQG